jgi:uncharacterized protein (PEP-CTERM system associated)
MSHRMMPRKQIPHTDTGQKSVAQVFSLAPFFVGLCAAGLACTAGAQVTGGETSASIPDASAAGTRAAATTQQPSSGKRAQYIEPRVSVSQTFTDNVELSDANKRADSITQLSAGIRAVSDGGRIRGYFDYSLSKALHARATEKSSTTNALNAFGTAELVDKWAFVDVNGTISRQSLSAFGTQTLEPTTSNANSTEVANYRISPYVRGRALGTLNYEARYTAAITRTKSNTASDIDQTDASFRIGSDSVPGKLNWSVDLSSQDTEYSLGRDVQADRLRLVLNYSINPQLGVYAIAGRESNNYASFNKESHGSGGAGVNWAVSDRTRLGAEAENRFFARTHKISFEHRTPRTIWKYVDGKDVTTNAGQGAGGLGSIGSLYDLFFAQFASIQPDPILRAQLVNAFLQANGLNPNAPSTGGLLSSEVMVQRRQDLSLALLGARDTVTFLASRTASSRIEGVPRTGDDLALTPSLDQRNFTVSYARRLSQDASLNVLAGLQKTAAAAGLAGNTLKTVNVSLSSRIGLKVTGSVGFRRAVFDGSTPYTENAVFGSLSAQF